MRIRPCIDLREGRVVQIVGGTLSGSGSQETAVVNFETEKPAAAFAALYREDALPGGHVIALGPGNEEAALSALAVFPGGLQMGGGITPENAGRYLDAGASHVIVTSWVFQEGRLNSERLAELVRVVGRERLTLDLSCRRRGDDYLVVTDRWQKFTELAVNPALLDTLSRHCSEFLVHGVDVEGRRAGIDAGLVPLLKDAPIPVTYAGGVRSWDDIRLIETLGDGQVDVTVGSALDIFGGTLPYRELADWQKAQDSL